MWEKYFKCSKETKMEQKNVHWGIGFNFSKPAIQTTSSVVIRALFQ